MRFPDELASLPQWICWRLEPDPKNDKPRKVPYDPKTGRKASSTNPQSWATLAQALAAKDKYLFTGVGFVFTEVGGIVGVDIDHCRNEDGSFNETAQAILDKAPSYTEISPSGSGLHIFFRQVRINQFLIFCDHKLISHSVAPCRARATKTARRAWRCTPPPVTSP